MDEAGRGALAGPLLVAAVVLPPDFHLEGLDDSKKVPPKRRQLLAREITREALSFAVVRREPEEIDRLNVFRATQDAMRQAVSALDPPPACVVSDAVPLEGLLLPVVVETRADAQYLCVAAASVLAKVARDAIMEQLHKSFPEFDWCRNKGYPTPGHLAALARRGASPWHRRSYAPVRMLGFKKEFC